MVSSGGRPKVGYNRLSLIDDIEQFLGYDNTTDAVMIGAGKLGQALLDYKGFEAYGLNILAAFDIHPVADHTDGGKPILPMEELESFCRMNKVPWSVRIQVEAEALEACHSHETISVAKLLSGNDRMEKTREFFRKIPRRQAVIFRIHSSRSCVASSRKMISYSAP